MTPPTTSSPRRLPLRWHLIGLAIGAVLPVVVFAVLLVAQLARKERAAVERQLVSSARMMASGVDREIAATIRTLEVMAQSERLDRADLEGFHSEAWRAQRTQPSWVSVLLLSPDGRQLVSSSQPWGAVLGPANELESLRRTVETRRPVVGPLTLGRLGRWAFPVRVPVVRDGRLKYVLTAAVTPSAFSELIARQSPAQEEWTRTIADHKDVVVARTRSPELFVGKPGTPSFLQQTRAAGEGVLRSTTLEGIEVYSGFSHAPFCGWTAVVTARVEVLDGPGRRSVLTAAGLGLALLLLSGLGAFLLSRRIAREIGSAASAADALAHGGQPRVEPSSVAEVARLGEALERSAELLLSRERERDEHLARAEAARVEAEAASRSKDEFLAMLGHELRNPLAPIVTALEVLRLRGQMPEREMGILQRQVKHLTRLVDDLLDVSRITRGKVEIRREPVELSAAVAKGIEMAGPLVEQRGHELTVDVPPHGLEVHGDPIRLSQVVANLLTNAARYTEPGGHIAVRAWRDGEEVALSVTDDGRGISEDLLPRVFDLFVQGPRTIDRREGGLGIGLTLVRSLVTLHGGRVEARSDGPGLGSTFLVRLPALVPAAELSGSLRSAP
ncbi:MAG: sensor histidine kinase [Acidobacteriota bacterium]